MRTDSFSSAAFDASDAELAVVVRQVFADLIEGIGHRGSANTVARPGPVIEVGTFCTAHELVLAVCLEAETRRASKQRAFMADDLALHFVLFQRRLESCGCRRGERRDHNSRKCKH